MAITAQQYNDDVSTDRLYHFGENTGTDVADTHGTSNMTLSDAGMWSTKFRMGRAGIKTNGSSYSATAGNWTDSADGTIEFWMNLDVTHDASTAGGQLFIVRADDAGGKYVNIDLMGVDGGALAGKMRFQVYDSAGGGTVASSKVSWTGGVWYHIAGLWGTGGLDLLVDGVSVGTDVFAGQVGASTELSWFKWGTTYAPAMSIDELRISTIRRRSFGNTLGGINL